MPDPAFRLEACSSHNLRTLQAPVGAEVAAAPASRPVPAAQLRLTWEPRLMLTWQPQPEASAVHEADAGAAPDVAEGGDPNPNPGPAVHLAAEHVQLHAELDGEPTFQCAWEQTGGVAGGLALAAGVGADDLLPFTPAKQARALRRSARINAVPMLWLPACAQLAVCPLVVAPPACCAVPASCKMRYCGPRRAIVTHMHAVLSLTSFTRPC